MIESGHITDVAERARSPFAAVIAQFQEALMNATHRAHRQGRDFHTVNERKAIAFYQSSLAKILLLEG